MFSILQLLTTCAAKQALFTLNSLNYYWSQVQKKETLYFNINVT